MGQSCKSNGHLCAGQHSGKGQKSLGTITFLELVPIAMAFSIWGTKLAGKRVILHTDNKALVSILNTQTSKSHALVKVVSFARVSVQYPVQGNTYNGSR